MLLQENVGQNEGFNGEFRQLQTNNLMAQRPALGLMLLLRPLNKLKRVAQIVFAMNVHAGPIDIICD
jgi:hypothetical protein